MAAPGGVPPLLAAPGDTSPLLPEGGSPWGETGTVPSVATLKTEVDRIAEVVVDQQKDIVKIGDATQVSHTEL